MQRLLDSNKKPSDLFAEIHERYLPQFGSSASEVMNLIKSSGYSLHSEPWKRDSEYLFHFKTT